MPASDLRERILDATAELLAGPGYHAVNTNAIARTAGCSVGSVYVYFTDKHAVLAALLERYGDRLLEAVAAPVARWTDRGDWRDLVGDVVDAFVAFYVSEPGYRALWIGAQLSDSTVSAGRTWADAARVQFGAVLRRIRPGLTPARAELAAEAAIYAVSSVVTRSLEREEPALLDEARKLAVRYLAPLLEPADPARSGGSASSDEA